ncbi:MAG TPA: FAD-dependent oxidoreductase [Polyangiaceae bacterium]|nr:FAD-dependent oxidoreductase [Polyangiaceae bacterium]
MPQRFDVMIVGAGPTGLALALWLRRLGIGVRIIDKAPQPGASSRALAVHARTLELYRQLGIAGDVVARALPFAAVNLWVRGRHRARAAFGDIGRGLSPFPGVWIFPQDQHERLLVEHLHASGVDVERGTELLDFQQGSGSFLVSTRGPDGTETACEATYLAGCDGAHSRVRDVLGVGLPGGTYSRVFYVADVVLRGPVDNHELHIALDDADLLAIFPMKGDHTARLVGTLEASADARNNLGWSDVSHEAMRKMTISVDRVNWLSTYRVHHRVAERFRIGRAFLLGDAAHIHSPVGGQGMNTGIGDAVNLAWKLAAAIRGQGPGLLDSYEPERRAFAERLVATTDRVFTLANRDGAMARVLRIGALPTLMPWAMRSSAARGLLFSTISQIRINYRHSALSHGKAGGVHGGDRLPWVARDDPSGEDNFTPLASNDWQVHVYGAASSELEQAAARSGIPLHRFAWEPAAERAGLARNAAYLVRPDGYVGLADPAASPETLERYVRGLREPGVTQGGPPATAG